MAAFSLSANTNRRQRKYAFGPDRAITMCIYSITHRESGKKYVGITRRAAGDRWRSHVWSSEREGKACPLVSRAIEKYGADAFSFSVIDIAESRDQLAHKEQFWINELNTLAPNGYNLSTGGYVGSDVSDETRAKLKVSAANRTDSWTEKQSAARAAWFEADPERRIAAAERARKCHAGRKQSAEQIEARAAGKRGMALSHEQRVTLARSHMRGRVIECSNGESYLSAYEAAVATGADQDKIGSVCTGKRKSTRGLVFWYGSTA